MIFLVAIAALVALLLNSFYISYYDEGFREGKRNKRNKGREKKDKKEKPPTVTPEAAAAAATTAAAAGVTAAAAAAKKEEKVEEKNEQKEPSSEKQKITRAEVSGRDKYDIDNLNTVYNAYSESSGDGLPVPYNDVIPTGAFR